MCLQQIQRLFERTTGFVRFPVGNGPLELPINFLFKNSAPDRIKHGAHGHHPGQYVSTVMFFVPETLETGGVACDPCETVRNVLTSRTLLSRQDECSEERARTGQGVPPVTTRVVTVPIRQRKCGGVRGEYHRYRSCSGTEKNTSHTARLSCGNR